MRSLQFVAVLVIALTGCKAPVPAAGTAAQTTDKPKLAEPEPDDKGWYTQPPAQWPQLVLTNNAAFEGHTSLVGASSFLISGPKEGVFLETARHLIGADGGVEPELALAHLDSDLKSWVAHPRTRPDDVVRATRLAFTSTEPGEDDWLVLHTAPAQQPPAQVLKLRTEPAKIGEQVFLVGCPYSEEDCLQNVYTGTVVASEFENSVRFNLDEAIELAGFSGAPLVDTKGRVLGVMAFSLDSGRADGKTQAVGAEDAPTVLKRLGWGAG